MLCHSACGLFTSRRPYLGDLLTAAQIEARSDLNADLKYELTEEQIRRRYDAMKTIVDSAEREKLDLFVSESRRWEQHNAEFNRLVALKEKLEPETVDFSQIIDTGRAEVAEGRGYDRQARTAGGFTYGPHSAQSWVKDLKALHTSGDPEARDRLLRNNAEAADAERRAVPGLAGNVAGSGGEFVPPAFLVAQLAEFARPGRVFADRLQKHSVPREPTRSTFPG